jgi:hypothetical protein
LPDLTRNSLDLTRNSFAVSGMQDVATHVKEHIVWLDAEIKKLEKEIDDHIDRRDVQLITSIPGIGKTTVTGVPGHLGDIRRFDSAKAFLLPMPQYSSAIIKDQLTFRGAE